MQSAVYKGTQEETISHENVFHSEQYKMNIAQTKVMVGKSCKSVINQAQKIFMCNVLQK